MLEQKQVAIEHGRANLKAERSSERQRKMAATQRRPAKDDEKLKELRQKLEAKKALRMQGDFLPLGLSGILPADVCPGLLLGGSRDSARHWARDGHSIPSSHASYSVDHKMITLGNAF